MSETSSIEAQRRALALVEFVIEKATLFARLKGQINERQEKALLRMFREGPEAFEEGTRPPAWPALGQAEGLVPGMSAGKYATITGASPATTTRDLVNLVDKGALVRAGERRHARYHLAVPLRAVKQVVVGEGGELVES